MSIQNELLQGHIGATIPELSHNAKIEPTPARSSLTPQNPDSYMKSNTVEVRTSFAGTSSGARSCKKWCSCVCHKQNHLKFSTPLTYVLGSLFVGYSGLPVSTPPCNEHSCLRRAIPALEFSYYFPGWFLARSLLMSLKLVPLAGPELTLRMPRLIRWTTKEANLFHSARAGKLEAIQSMFTGGIVTPFDVTLSLGESALFVRAPELFGQSFGHYGESADVTIVRGFRRAIRDMQVSA